MTKAGRERRRKARQREIIIAKVVVRLLVLLAVLSGMMVDSAGSMGWRMAGICVISLILAWLIDEIYIPTPFVHNRVDISIKEEAADGCEKRTDISGYVRSDE